MHRRIVRWFLAMAFMVCATASAQVPKLFNYQSVVHRPNGQLVVNSQVGIRMSILQGGVAGSTVFMETMTSQTNAQGLFTVMVGGTNPITSIDWHNGPYFIKIEVDPDGGTNYMAPDVQQIISVPYAIYSEVADSLRGNDLKEHQILTIGHDTIYLTGGSRVVLPPDFSGNYNHLTNRPTSVSSFTNDAGYITNEVQVLSISNDTIFLTGGSFVKLPEGFSGDYNDLTNKPTIPTATSQLVNNRGYLTGESQILWISNDTIFLTGGSSVKVPFQPEFQNLSDVTLLGNSAFSQLKEVVNPTDPQDAVTKYYLDSLLANSPGIHGTHGTFNVFNITSCGAYQWHGVSYSSPGVYTYPYQNELGFPSVDTLKLTINVQNNNSFTRRASGSYSWHDTVYTQSGDYQYHYLDVYGCPSTDTLHLTIVPGSRDCVVIRSETDTATAVVCGGLTWYGTLIRQNGVYQHSLGHISDQGCDSIVKVNVSILPVFQQDTLARITSSITWRGNVYTQQGDYGDTLIAANGCDSIFMLHLMEGGQQGIGAAPGLFSVSNGVQVRFAQGNLQCQTSSGIWQFARHQYDMTGLTCDASYYTTWADLFGWATSGYHDNTDNLNLYYRPWDSYHVSAPKLTYEYENNQYGYGPSLFMNDTNLVNSSRYYDWGMYHSIVNGGNGAGLWRLMSKEEWDYLLNRRNNASYLHSLGRIDNIPTENGLISVSGFIILSDNWNRPGNINFVPNASSCDENVYDLGDWKILEASGAVFLPMIQVDWDRAYGNYWTRSCGGSGGAYALTMNRTSCILAPYNRSDSYSVRLVQEHTAGVTDCRCTYLDTNIVATGSFSWHGYTYSRSGDYVETIVNQAGCDSVISLSLMLTNDPELTGVFSVSDSTHVKFSRGNLQYKPSADIWRFASHQYDYIGKENRNASATYSGWIDLYSWATSGYHHRGDVLNRFYRPYDAEGNSINFGPSVNMDNWNLVRTSAQYDWGVHNAVSNGGNSPGMWRTLTSLEWQYLLAQRPNADQLQGRATVNGVRGLLLLPDNWSAPAGVVFTPDADNYDTNSYTEARWLQMEQAGAVFLPAGGWREGRTNVRYPNYTGLYWSTTVSTDGMTSRWTGNAWYLLFSLAPIGQNYHAIVSENTWDGLFSFGSKQFGYSVRLVKDY